MCHHTMMTLMKPKTFIEFSFAQSLQFNKRTNTTSVYLTKPN